MVSHPFSQVLNRATAAGRQSEPRSICARVDNTALLFASGAGFTSQPSHVSVRRTFRSNQINVSNRFGCTKKKKDKCVMCHVIIVIFSLKCQSLLTSVRKCYVRMMKWKQQMNNRKYMSFYYFNATPRCYLTIIGLRSVDISNYTSSLNSRLLWRLLNTTALLLSPLFVVMSRHLSEIAFLPRHHSIPHFIIRTVTFCCSFISCLFRFNYSHPSSLMKDANRSFAPTARSFLHLHCSAHNELSNCVSVFILHPLMSWLWIISKIWEHCFSNINFSTLAKLSLLCHLVFPIMQFRHVDAFFSG